MTNESDKETEEAQPKPATLGESWAHLFVGGSGPSPEDAARESARRRGRRTRGWWKAYLPDGHPAETSK